MVFSTDFVLCLGVPLTHKVPVRTFKEYHRGMSPRRNWDSPQPLSRQRVFPSPQNQGGGAHSPAGEGLGESQFRRLEKSLALCLLCALSPHSNIWGEWGLRTQINHNKTLRKQARLANWINT